MARPLVRSHNCTIVYLWKAIRLGPRLFMVTNSIHVCLWQPTQSTFVYGNQLGQRLFMATDSVHVCLWQSTRQATNSTGNKATEPTGNCNPK